MPAPRKIAAADLRATAAVLVEDHGPAALTMTLVASRLGVRAPSLYKHVADREALLGLVRDDAMAELTATMSAAERAVGVRSAPGTRIRAQARAVRAYALRRPQSFSLVFQPNHLPPASPDALMTSVAPLLRACHELVGPDRALDATRALTAWLTGFIAMENAAAFQLDGDIDEAFTFGVDVSIAGITAMADAH